MKLNLGCGFNKAEGYLNVDASAECAPDQVVDLEQLPWPFDDDCAEEIQMSHVLEHLGAAPDTFLDIMKELYRVCRDGALVRIVVPHPRHDSFIIDPTHVRPILPETLRMFSKSVNREWRENGAANTPLGLYLDIDFELESVNYILDPSWQGPLQEGKIEEAEVFEAMNRYNNVVGEIQCVLKAVKP